MKKKKLASIEIELQKQREKQACVREESIIPLSSDPKPTVREHIPGFFFDEQKQRYFRATGANEIKDSNHKSNKMKNIHGYIMYIPQLSIINITSSLHNREIYGPLKSRKNLNSLNFANFVWKEISIQIMQPSKVSRLCFHPEFGIAYSGTDCINIRSYDYVSRFISISSISNLKVIQWCPITSRAIITGILECSKNSVLQMFCYSHDAWQSVSPPATVSKSFIDPHSSLLNFCYSGDGSFLILCTEAGVAKIDVHSFTPCGSRRMESSVMAAAPTFLGAYSSDTFVLGLRNGSISILDTRAGLTSKSASMDIGKLSLCCDHLIALRDGWSIVAQDVTGAIKVYDVRRRSCCKHSRGSAGEILSIRDSIDGALLRNRKFWISPDESSVYASTELPPYLAKQVYHKHLDERRGNGMEVGVGRWSLQHSYRLLEYKTVPRTTPGSPETHRVDNWASLVCNCNMDSWCSTQSAPYDLYFNDEVEANRSQNIRRWTGLFGVYVGVSGERALFGASKICAVDEVAVL